MHSLAKLLSLYKGLKFTLVSPRSLEMPTHIVERLTTGDHVIEQTSDLHAGLASADVVYARAFRKSVSRTSQSKATRRTSRSTRRGSMKSADAIAHHASVAARQPPRHEQSRHHLNHDSRLAIFRQTDNGIAVRMATFATLLGVEHLIGLSMRDATWRSPSSIGPDDAVFQGFD